MPLNSSNDIPYLPSDIDQIILIEVWTYRR